MSDFEVIVVGAGPAGAMITKELAERKFSVVCIEKELEVGYPNKSTAATPLDTFESFSLPRELGFDDLVGARVFGPSDSCTIELEKPIGRLLKFRETKQYLIKEAIKAGAHLLLGTEVIGAHFEDNELAGVVYKGYEGEGKLTADVVVDASGPEGILATKLEIWKKNKDQLGLAFEYFFENAKPGRSKNGSFYLDFFMGKNIAPGGYGWIFPTSPSQVKAGICKLLPTVKFEGEKSQKEYFQKIWRENSQIRNAQPFEIHECAHYITGGIENATRDNFIAIGDAVNKVHPIFGEGVRSSFYSARFAAEAIDKARKHKDYKQKALSLYDKLWKEKWGKNWQFSMHAYQFLYNADDEQLDALIKTLAKINPEILLRLYIGRATKKDYLVLLRQAPALIDRKLIMEAIKHI